MSGGGGGGEPAPGGFIVKSVEFKGDKFSPVFRDSGTEYNPPHWLDSDEDGSDNHPQLGDRQFPVTYGRNDTVKLKVEFKTLNGGWPLPTDPQLQLCVAGFGPNNIKTEIVCLGRPAGAISWQIPLTATEPLTTYVHAYQPFTIHWRAIWAAGAPTYEDSNWGTFGISSNPLYVTYEKARSTAYHSLVYNATVSAEGMSNWQIILNANWQSFTSFSIVWKEPKPWDIVNSTVPTQAQRLFYYGKWTIGEGSLATLLSDRDGQCGAWADFWTNEILVQGITEVSPELVRIDAPANEVGFLINSWKKENNGTSTDPTHPYKLTFQSITPRHGSNVLDEKKYNFLASDLKDMDGITSQGSGTFGSPNGHANPAADFNMHLVVLLNGRIYDPSYGRDFATIAAWEESAIYGYYKVPNASEWNVRENAPGKEVQTLTHPNLP